MVKVILPDGSVKEFKTRSIYTILKKLNLKQNTVLVTRNEELLTFDINLNEGDEIKIISVVSGG